MGRLADAEDLPALTGTTDPTQREAVTTAIAALRGWRF
jgi:hypothetical protein